MTVARKILLSAYACEPGKGSEPGVGWNWVSAIAESNQVWVITRSNNRPRIENELARKPIANVQWAYFDLPRALRFWKKGQRGTRLYYFLWQIGAFRLGRSLQDMVGFDLVHHLTFGKYWSASFLSLMQPPFVWGPLGGGESAPDAFKADFGWKGKAYETLRDAGRRTAGFDPFLRMTARRSALALSKTSETAKELRDLGCKRVVICSEVGMSRAEIDALATATSSNRGDFKLLSIGRLIHWKGFHIALMAFAQMQRSFSKAEYRIIGDGPEIYSLRQLVRELHLEHKVKFLGALSREKTLATLIESDVLVHPSLHDSGGWVCVEAMACGKPVICLELGGPAYQVTAQTGFKVAAQNPDQAVRDMSAAMVRLAVDPGLRFAMGAGGQARVNEHFAMENIGRTMTSLYDELKEESNAYTSSLRHRASAVMFQP